MRMKIMTFNIRYDNPLDGINAFAGRREMILEFLRRERPDPDRRRLLLLGHLEAATEAKGLKCGVRRDIITA